MSRPAGAAVDPALHPPTSGVTPLLLADRKPGLGVGQLRKAACRRTHPSGLASVTLRPLPDGREATVTAVTTRHQAVSPSGLTSPATCREACSAVSSSLRCSRGCRQAVPPRLTPRPGPLLARSSLRCSRGCRQAVPSHLTPRPGPLLA